MTLPIQVFHLGCQPYVPVWHAMQAQMQMARADVPEALWEVQHPAVFTLGRHGDARHVYRPGAIPVIRVDRGGQVTWHGPGQVVLYPLLELQRHGLGVRRLVELLQDTILEVLAEFGIPGEVRREAPGVYVQGQKIASLGLRIQRGWSCHGLSLNVCPSLADFARIAPCGDAQLSVTSLQALGVRTPPATVSAALSRCLLQRLDRPAQHMPGLPEPLVSALALRTRAEARYGRNPR